MTTAPPDWTRAPLLAFDLETTGINPHRDRIVTAAIVDIRAGQRPATTTWLTDPGIDIPTEATEVHGITTTHARQHGQAPDVALHEIAGVIALALTRGTPVVIANAAYDVTMLETECVRHGVPTLAERLGGADRIRPILDPQVLDKAADPFRKGICPCGCGATAKKLTDLCLHYGVRHTGAHDATGDALAAARLVPAILGRYWTQGAPQRRGHGQALRAVSAAGLHASQIYWRREQADGLRAYFDRAGIDHDGVPGEWPLLPTPIRVEDQRPLSDAELVPS